MAEEFKPGDRVRYAKIGGVGTFNGRRGEVVRVDGVGLLDIAWEGGERSYRHQPDFFKKLEPKKLDAEKRDQLVRQLESDVVTLMNDKERLKRWNAYQASRVQRLKSRVGIEREDAGRWEELARERHGTIDNLQKKVTEQASQLLASAQQKASLEQSLNEATTALTDLARPDDKLSEQVLWKNRYDRACERYEREKQRLSNYANDAAEKLSAVRKLVQYLEKRVEADLSASPAEFSERSRAASDRKGAYESSAACIGRGFATKKILDRLKAALGEGEYESGLVEPEKYFMSTFGEKPKTRYWLRDSSNYDSWAVYRETPNGQAAAWYHTGNHWYDFTAPISLFNKGAREISASDLPEGVTP